MPTVRIEPITIVDITDWLLFACALASAWLEATWMICVYESLILLTRSAATLIAFDV